MINESIKAVRLPHPNGRPADTAEIGGAADHAAAFHRSFPNYAPTPLADLKELAAVLGLGRIYVKDESRRFGLNAFKGLGASYAAGRYLAERLGIPQEELSYESLRRAVQAQRPGLTFVTATDGNHGRSVAWTALALGLSAVVYMPAGSSPERLAHIRDLGAEASVTPYNYDEAVRFAAAQGEKNGWILVQDTAWAGYTDIPQRIMQGYTTMAAEADTQMGELPTHIFLQAGVGSMAGAVTAYFAARGGQARHPVVTVVEPNRADCLYRTAAANDGTLHTVTGDIGSIMAGLSCGEPNPLAWEILRDHADHFVSVPEWTAAKGMRILGNPPGSDPRVVSGESGAVTTGLVAALMQDPHLEKLRERIGLGPDARVRCKSSAV